MSVTNHGGADVSGPNFCVGEAFFQRATHLAEAATDFEDSLHLPVGGHRNIVRSQLVDLVLLVVADGADVKTVGAIVIHVTGERIADITAGLNVNFVLRVVWDFYTGIQGERAGAVFIGGFHFCKVHIGVGMEVVLQ